MEISKFVRLSNDIFHWRVECDKSDDDISIDAITIQATAAQLMQ
jgi:hypothetical protein